MFFLIGDTLRQERESQNLTIQDVEKGTSIRAIYIDALEKGEYDKLPGTVYAKGFIKNYGNFLSLDGESLVRQFVMEISPSSSVVDKNGNSQFDADNNANESETRSRSKTREDNKADSDSNKFMLIAGLLILLLAGGLLYHFAGTDKDTAVAGEQTTVENPAVDGQPVETPAVENPPVESVPPVVEQPIPPPIQNSNVTLQAIYKDDCWTLVTVDGVVVYEGVINAGETFEWIGNQSVQVRLGNAGAVEFIQNGQNVGALGALGDIADHVFTR